MAGLLYLIIIITGLSAEMGIRMPFIHTDKLWRRLIQTVLIAANLMAMQTALLIFQSAGQIPIELERALALVFVDLHGHGYDLGLFFIGINSLLTGALIWQSGYFSKVFGVGLAIAGIVYLIGSSLRFFVPDY